MKIEDIYRSLDNYHNQLNANKEKFEKIYNESISSTIGIRDILLTIITSIFGVLFTVKEDSFNGVSVQHLLLVTIFVGIFVYIIFYIIKRDKHKKLLEILKEFHDGFTTISFMKGLLDRILLGIENLKTDQIEALDDYYTMVKGGIAFQIRREITKSLKEEEIYGNKENDLYTILIHKAYDLSKVLKGEKKREEELLNSLFVFETRKYDLLAFKKIFDCYKTSLEEHYLGKYNPTVKKT